MNAATTITDFCRQSIAAIGDDDTQPLDHRVVPLAVLALQGEAQARQQVLTLLRQAADDEVGLHDEQQNGLNMAFTLRHLVEVYQGLITAGIADTAHQRQVIPWLYEHGRIRASEEIRRQPWFQDWHQKNQHVPTTCVYLIADCVEHSTCAGDYDTKLLLNWADRRMVGWDYNWRCPDDSWLYHVIWVWSAYLHARIRRPELLTSENARESFNWYKQLSIPGGFELIFGESQAGDLLGPLVAYVLGARLFRDGELLYQAHELLHRAQQQGLTAQNLFRSCKWYRIYSEWPHDLEPVKPASLRSTIILSPLPGRGWSIGDTPYNDAIKTHDPRFPAHGRDLYDNDDLYLVNERYRFLQTKPDKLIFRHGYESGALQAIIDLRAQGLHDHPDALGVAALFSDGIPWLVESGYQPRGYNRQRWLHNVPLYRPGFLPPEELLTWRSDTWREVEAGDWTFDTRDGLQFATLRLRADTFDYVDFTGDAITMERLFIHAPDEQLLIMDRFHAHRPGRFTIGQVWHTTSEQQLTGDHWQLSRGDQHFAARFAQSIPVESHLSQHPAPDKPDDLYYPGPVTDLLRHACVHLQPDQPITLAATFGRHAWPLELHDAQIQWGDHQLPLA